MRTRFLLSTFSLLLVVASFATTSFAQTSNGWGKGGNPKPSPSPTPVSSPSPSATPALIDAQRVWGNTGTNFNANASWTAGSGGLAPVAGDVAAFSGAEVTNPQLTANTSIAGLYFSGTGTSGYTLTRSATQTFTLTGFATSIGAETGDSNAVAIGAENTSGTNTISIPIILAPASGSTSTIFQAGSGTLSISGVISGTGIALTKTGTGTLTLSANNTFTGALTVQEGTVSINSVNTNNNAQPLGKQNNVAVVLGGSGTTGTLEFTGATDSTDKTFTMAAGGTGVFQIDSAGTILTLSGVISGSGNLTKAGPGTLLLNQASNANTYTGTTTINAGTLQIGNNDVLPTTTALILANVAGVTFDLNGNNQTIGSLSGGGTTGGTVDFTGHTLTVGDSTSTTFAGVLAGTGAAKLVKQGTGTLTLTGNNTYNDATTISAGVLNIQNSNALGLTGHGTTVASGAALELQGGIAVGTEALSLAGTGISNGGALRNVSGDNSWAGVITIADTPSITRINSDSGTLTINGAINEAGGMSKTLTFGGAGNTTVNGIISSAATELAIAKDGAGTLTLTAANTYSGATTVSTTVSGGTLLANNTTGSATGTGGVTVSNSGTTLGGNGTITGTVSVGSGANLSPGATGVGSTAILHTGALTLSSGSFFNVDLNNTTVGTGYDQVSVTGAVSITSSNLVVTAANSLLVGQKFFILANDSTDAITGTFAQGSTVTANNGDVFSISYVADFASGNSTGGNDILLTVVTAVPEPSTYVAAALALLALVYFQRQRLAQMFKRGAVSAAS